MLDKDILTIRSSLDKGEITATDLINEAKEKIEKYNDDINAFNLTIFDEGNNESKSVLNNIPYALKDNISTKGIRTTACSNTLKDYVPVYDATIYTKLKESGAIMVGKTNMDELALGGTGKTGNTGIVHNPWDTSRIAGGSSSGSASAVARGIVPFAIGSDTGDSIRKPAAFCGIVGYKPTYGLISRYGLFAFASSLDHLGVFARNVKDVALVTDTVKGSDPKDMTSINDFDNISIYDSLNSDVKGKKIFYIKEICDESLYENNDTKEILKEFKNTLDKCKSLGIEVYEESVDIGLLKAIKPIYDCISCAEATSNDSNLTGINFGPRGKGSGVMDMMKDHRTNGFSPLIKRRFVIGSFVLQKENQEKYFLNAKRVRRLLVEKFNELFKKYDGLILPASGKVAPLIDEVADIITRNEEILENHMAIGNFGGYPSITIPNGLYKGLPTGINITSGYKEDIKLLSIASAIEEVLGYKNMCVKEDK